MGLWVFVSKWVVFEVKLFIWDIICYCVDLGVVVWIGMFYVSMDECCCDWVVVVECIYVNYVWVVVLFFGFFLYCVEIGYLCEGEVVEVYVVVEVWLVVCFVGNYCECWYYYVIGVILEI